LKSSLINTDRLTLRDFVETDWEAFNALLSDPEATRWMHFSSWNLQDRQNFFQWILEHNRLPASDNYQWAIELKSTAELIGWFGIGGASHPSVEGACSFGYILSRAHWGQGYMTEALRAVIAFEFDTLQTPMLTATCETNNPASARVMEKAGMRWIKTVHDSDFEGNWAERHHYAIARPTV
jgi:RimJ/RimL family protein N-acetyltransferase